MRGIKLNGNNLTSTHAISMCNTSSESSHEDILVSKYPHCLF